MNHVLKTKNTINVVVASKHPRPQWLTMTQAIRHCEKGLGIWSFASNDLDNKPDLVMACAGDTPTLEVMAATSILRKYIPNLKIRVVNVVDLMRLEPESAHPHGLSDQLYDYIFTLAVNIYRKRIKREKIDFRLSEDQNGDEERKGQ